MGRAYAPLRESSDLFRPVRVGGHGTDIVGTDEIDRAADTPWRLSPEQSGATITAEAFRRWRESHAFTLDRAQVDDLPLAVGEAVGIEPPADDRVLARPFLVLVQHPVDRRAVAEHVAPRI